MSYNIVVATDGSGYVKKKFHEGSSGVNIFINGERILELGCYHINGTNSQGEVYAILMGLSRLKDIILEHPRLKDSTITLLSDSQYAIKSLNSYMPKGWVKQGLKKEWKTRSGEPVSWQHYFKKIWSEFHDGQCYKILGIPILIFHINSHIKNPTEKHKAYHKFQGDNNLDISKEEFEMLIKYNEFADKTADMIRNTKASYYERSFSKWASQRKIETRNGRIVIKRTSAKD